MAERYAGVIIQSLQGAKKMSKKDNTFKVGSIKKVTNLDKFTNRKYLTKDGKISKVTNRVLK